MLQSVQSHHLNYPAKCDVDILLLFFHISAVTTFSVHVVVANLCMSVSLKQNHYIVSFFTCLIINVSIQYSTVKWTCCILRSFWFICLSCLRLNMFTKWKYPKQNGELLDLFCFFPARLFQGLSWQITSKAALLTKISTMMTDQIKFKTRRVVSDCF